MITQKSSIYTCDPAEALPEDTAEVADNILLAYARAWAKAVVVDVLGGVLVWRPSIAMYLGKLVTRVWGGFGRA